MGSAERITLLREEMRKEGIHVYLVPTGDYHGSEYVGEWFKVREFLSGFTGSAGTLVVTGEEAGLWTDGRYFIQAEKELAGSGIRLFRMQEPGVPTIGKYLQDKMNTGEVLAFDGRCLSAGAGIRYEQELEQAGKKVTIRYDIDLGGRVWGDERPAVGMSRIWQLESEWSGKSCPDKLREVRERLSQEGAEALLLTKLDDLMWLFNIRGNDIPCNPVAYSYGYISREEAILFVRDRKEKLVSAGLRQELTADGVTVADYDGIMDWVKDRKGRRIWLDREQCNYTLYRLAAENARPLLKENPTGLMKAVKNPTELDHIREIYRRDSAAVIRFIKWLKEEVKEKTITEVQAAAYLDRLRQVSEGFLDYSFPTICAYGENGAMMHYEAKEGACSKILPEGLLLVDSGGQYLGGTTDVTRTIVLGETAPEVRKEMTAVVRGMLGLSEAVFLHGCTGRNLDILAREPLWQMGIDYKCGTGHGIGYMLNVHEGPQNIRFRAQPGSGEAALEAGMLVSDEPGVYREGCYGIRIENILAVKEVEENQDGRFLGFETLTLVPIDRAGIDAGEMTGRELRQLNDYHRRVYEEMSDYLTAEEREWLADATKPIGNE